MFIPCCKKLAAQNHNVLKIVKSLMSFCSPILCSMCHSYGENRLTRKRITLMPTYAKPMHIQISTESGDVKLKTLGFFKIYKIEIKNVYDVQSCYILFKTSSFGLYTIILMPRFINGNENSTACSLTSVMVILPIARSASCLTSSPIIPFQLPLASIFNFIYINMNILSTFLFESKPTFGSEFVVFHKTKLISKIDEFA